MCISYIVSVITIVILLYIIFMNYQNKENFYPYRGWGHRGWGGRWGRNRPYLHDWNRPYLHDWGNWRPYSYYPAYSGYWNKCPNGEWNPANVTC